MKNKRKKQISESLTCGIVLALSGGSMDAYSYIFRGEVFANAQTGNMLLFGVFFAEGNMPEALKYLWPVIAFTLGILLAAIMRKHDDEYGEIHWRQITVAIEAAFLISVAFIPQSLNPLANGIISFVCGIQVESFKKIHGSSIATTMCIGNLRSGTYSLTEYHHTKDKKYLRKGLLYYLIIGTFVMGAVIESRLIKIFGEKAILVSCILLMVALVLMFQAPAEEEEDFFVEG